MSFRVICIFDLFRIVVYTECAVVQVKVNKKWTICVNGEITKTSDIVDLLYQQAIKYPFLYNV